MFICHTPPFRGRGRRSRGRSWRTCPTPHGHGHTLGNRPRAVGVHFSSRLVPLCPVESAESELEDVGTEYAFRRAVPGVPADQFHVDVCGPVMTVRTLTEVPGRRFEWRVAIPDDVSNECITAEVEDGFLHVRLPKMQPRVIPVTSSSSSAATPREELWRFENWGSEYRLTHPAPGVQPSDVTVVVEEGVICVKVQGPNGRFSREVGIPPAVDVDAILVEIEEGVLIVTMPKMERDAIRVHCQSGPSASAPPRRPSGDDEDEILYDEARQNAP